MIRSIEDVDLESRRVIVRADLDCPIVEGKVVERSRIRACLPTLRHALNVRARVIVMGHLGSPAGTRVEQLTLEPIGLELADMLGTDVILTDDCVGDGARKVVSDLYGGRIALLENLRFHPGESDNDEKFARALASMADVYVNDALAAVGEPHASVVGVPRLMRENCSGMLLEKEIGAIEPLLGEVRRPFVALFGGSGQARRLQMLRKLVACVDVLLIGGALAHTFLAAAGRAMHDAPVETESLAHARSILETARRRSVTVLLPEDTGATALDIGPRSTASFAEKLERAGTILFNDPVGSDDPEVSSEATIQLVHATGRSLGHRVAAGADIAALLHHHGLESNFDHVSTAGDVYLRCLAGDDMPGLKALDMPELEDLEE